MKKILLFCIENINNAGDEILGVTTEWLVHKCCHCITVREQLIPNLKTLPFFQRLPGLLWRPIKSFNFRTGLYRIGAIYNLSYIIEYHLYFNSKIKNVDSIILPIGMLKFTTQELSYFFDLITKIADKRNIPVIMSAMSIAKPDNDDWRYHQLVRAINRQSVKMITTRDGSDGLTLLKAAYIRNRNIVNDYVGDPALWIPEVYGFPSKKEKHGKKFIGINLIRKNIYTDYKEQIFSSEQLISLYKDIIEEVEKRGYDWELFCNGMHEDYIVGQELLKELRLPKEKLINVPKDGLELVKIISKYDGVFGARLHACITSVALGVPVAGLLWDKKLHYFSKTMGIRKFFSEGDELRAHIIVDKLESVMSFNFDYSKRDLYKQKTLSLLNRILKECNEII